MKASEELLNHLNNVDGRIVKYAQIILFVHHNEYETVEGSLDQVLSKLDFDDEKNFCYSRIKEGTIWYSDGTWSSRIFEGDAGYGISYWKHIKCPSLPEGISL